MSKTRLLYAAPFYRAFLDSVYRRNPDLIHATYAQQSKFLMELRFGWSDAWERNLEALGTYGVETVITNAELTQKTWAREHGVEYSTHDWAREILGAQIREFCPDVLFFTDVKLITAPILNEIRRRNPQVRLVISWDGIGLRNPARFEGVDVLLSCVQHLATFYEQHGFRAYLLPMAFDAQILHHLQRRENAVGVSFVGGLSLFEDGHFERLKLLSLLVDQTNIEIWLSTNFLRQCARSTFDLARRGDLLGLPAHLTRLRAYGKVVARSHGEIYGLEMYGALASSRVTINSHIDVAGSTAGNMRLFEATGVGTCLLTDWKENLGDYFAPESEVVTYRSDDECVEKIRWLLANPKDRDRIAEAGQKRTLRDHTFAARARRLDQIIRESLEC